ncbi:MAG TPA: hypothetical protein VL286_03755 [Rhizomicrobium sp.]|nr:hypothetical protein [Rhizomicrobium sp.]
MMRLGRVGAVRAGVWLALAVIGPALSGCASIDDAVFGNGPASVEPSTVPEPDGGAADESAAPAKVVQAAPPAETAPAEADTAEAAQPAEGADDNAVAAPEETNEAPAAAPVASTPPPVAPAIVAAPGVRLAAIEPGTDTGTAIGHAAAGIRATLQDLQSRIGASAQQLAQLRSQSAQATTAYHMAAAQITAQLQIGTTRGNPQLVAQWNTAQNDLDQLSANINALNGIGAQLSDESARARALLDQIHATVEMSGAIDEDHRQLSVLEDETNQSMLVTDRLMRELTATLQRQTGYVGDERGRLTSLATAIKTGSLDGTEAVTRTASLKPAYSSPAATGALVTIHFNKGRGDYQQTLYAALSQALQTRPAANFDVIGVSPTRGSAAALQAAQSNARRHAQDVMRSMSSMGVPAARMEISSATDPSISTSEVRVFAR